MSHSFYNQNRMKMKSGALISRGGAVKEYLKVSDSAKKYFERFPKGRGGSQKKGEKKGKTLNS